MTVKWRYRLMVCCFDVWRAAAATAHTRAELATVQEDVETFQRDLQAAEGLMHTRVLRVTAQRWTHRYLARSLAAWMAWSKGKVAARYLSAKAILRLRNRRGAAAITAWRSWIERNATRRQVSRKVVLRLSNTRAAAAWDAWRHWAAERRRLRSVCSRCIARMTHKRSGRAFTAWVHRHRLLVRAKASTLKWRHRLVMGCFDVWRAAATHAALVSHREALVSQRAADARRTSELETNNKFLQAMVDEMFQSLAAQQQGAEQEGRPQRSRASGRGKRSPPAEGIPPRLSPA